MSENLIHKSEVKSKTAILEAIADVVSKAKHISIENARDIVAEHVECHDTPMHLYGHVGDLREDKATIICRKPFVEGYMGGSASNDIGWCLEKDGTYTEAVSRHDHGVWFIRAKSRFYQIAMCQEAIEQASAAGFVLHKVEEGANIKLEAVMVGSGGSGSHSSGW